MEQQGYYLYNQNKEEHGLNHQYCAALYLRFSKDDGKACDSSSIETQRMMLERYCLDNGITIHDFYVDDGYTGLNYDRPSFQRLLGDIDSGAVNMVITKDLSRLGRDYIQTGYYTEIFFPERKVRYVAINDGVDTLKSENDIAPFKNILNDMYSKDISRKVRSAQRQRALKGIFIKPNVPYGYRKDPNAGYRHLVDPEAAEVVKSIFKMALDGKGRMAISKALQEQKVLKPSEYHLKNGNKSYQHFTKKPGASPYLWSYRTLQTILSDRVYVGDMIHQQVEVTNYKTKKRARTSVEKHIVFENQHEPLVSREDFERVQQLIAARHSPYKFQFDNVFQGLLFCSECGRRMTVTNRKIKSKDKQVKVHTSFRCAVHYQNPERCTHSNYIYYDDLYSQVSDAIQKTIKKVLYDDSVRDRMLSKAQNYDSKKKARDEQAVAEKRLTELGTIVRKLYEDYALERLDLDNYKAMLAVYQTEQTELKQRLAVIRKELEQTNDNDEAFRKLKTLAAAYDDCQTLSAEMLNSLVERIEVRHPEMVENKKHQEITITYRFINSAL